ncbi:MAG: type II toxin-antitoxin system HicA family toxin [Candidatus Verstraetearchaeota archaeon]|nr:type II toxin-antitoxin system HicA family toxin [Candidatus Verstraetearchaeota archaeon]
MFRGEVIKSLHRAGFQVAGQRGSHIYLTDGRHKLTVPRHDQIKRGTLHSIILQAGLTSEEFLRLLKR